MAKPQCTQTHPKNRVFIFLAVTRASMQDKPHREQITATSEREARRLLAGRFILAFAGCLPVRGGGEITTPDSSPACVAEMTTQDGKGVREATPPSTITEIVTVQEVHHG